jgi:ABC-type sugar transport system ATPase subunit
MNLIPAQVRDGVLTVAGAPLRVSLPPGAPAELVLGVRPQDVSMGRPGDPDTVPGKVWMVELIGSERLIEVEVAPKVRVTAEVRASHRAARDDNVAVRLDPAQLHLFDPATGAVLSAASP